MAPYSSTLAWKIPWAEEPGRLQSHGVAIVGHDWATSLSLSCIGEGNGNPLQYSCLENPRDGGAWWAAVYGVAQSRTRLKWLAAAAAMKGGRRAKGAWASGLGWKGGGLAKRKSSFQRVKGPQPRISNYPNPSSKAYNFSQPWRNLIPST